MAYVFSQTWNWNNRVRISSLKQLNNRSSQKVPFDFQPKSQFFAAALTYFFSWLNFKQNPSLVAAWLTAGDSRQDATYTIPNEIRDQISSKRTPFWSRKVSEYASKVRFWYRFKHRIWTKIAGSNYLKVDQNRFLTREHQFQIKKSLILSE